MIGFIEIVVVLLWGVTQWAGATGGGEREGNHLLFKFKTIITSNHSKVISEISQEEEQEEEDDRHQPGARLWNAATVKTC